MDDSPIPEMRRLSIDSLRRDGETQGRVDFCQATVDQYAEALKAGKELPPPKVTVDPDGLYWLYDGFHTVAAYAQLGRKTLYCEALEGSQADARWLGAGSNVEHDTAGKRRTNADKRFAVTQAFRCPQAEIMLNAKVAEHCGVTGQFVGRVRADLIALVAPPDGIVGEPGSSAEETTGPILLAGMTAGRRKHKAETVDEPAIEPGKPKGGRLSQRSSLSEPALAFDAGRPEYLTGSKAQVAANCIEELQKLCECTVRLVQYADYFGCYHGQGQEALDRIMEATDRLKAILPRAATKKGS